MKLLIFFILLFSIQSFAQMTSSLDNEQVHKIIGTKIEVLNATKALIYGTPGSSLSQVSAKHKQFENSYKEFKKIQSQRPLLPQECEIFYRQVEKNVKHLRENIYKSVSHTLSSTQRNYAFTNLKSEALIYSLQLPLQLMENKNELGRYETISRENSCPFKNSLRRSSYISAFAKLVQDSSEVLASIHGQYGISTAFKNLQEVNKEAIRHYKKEAILIIPKLAMIAAVTRYGGQWLGAIVSSSSPIAGGMIMKSFDVVASSAFAMHTIMTNKVDIPGLTDLEPEQIRSTMISNENLMDQDEDSYLDLISFVSEFRKEFSQKILMPSYEKMIGQYSFINRMIQKHGSFDKAITHLQSQL